MANTPFADQTFGCSATPSSQPRMKQSLTAGATLSPPAKAISVHTQLGGRARIIYVPADNSLTDQVVDIYVADGWMSDTAVIKLVSVAAVDSGDVASVWGLYN